MAVAIDTFMPVWFVVASAIGGALACIWGALVHDRYVARCRRVASLDTRRTTPWVRPIPAPPPSRKVLRGATHAMQDMAVLDAPKHEPQHHRPRGEYAVHRSQPRRIARGTAHAMKREPVACAPTRAPGEVTSTDVRIEAYIEEALALTATTAPERPRIKRTSPASR
jgi:hypothetical protein